MANDETRHERIDPPSSQDPASTAVEPAAHSLVIRRASVDDLVAVKRLEDVSFGVGSYPYSFFRESIELFGDSFLVAFDDTGFAGYILASRIPADLEAAWILSLGVLPASRRRGVGTQLFRQVLARFQEQGVSSVKLSVDPSNAGAIRLYRSFGFQNLVFEPDYLGVGKDRMIMVRYR